MNDLNQEKFATYFKYCYCDCWGPEGAYNSEQDRQACLRIRASLHDLETKGFTKYDAILELCKNVNISFEIHSQLNFMVTITMFMNGKEWSTNTFNTNNKNTSKVLASELCKLLYVKFRNIIFIENALK